MNRLTIVRQISNILDNTCADCEVRRNIAGGDAIKKGMYGKADRHCIEFCDTGLKLKLLGNELTAEAKFRKG